MPYSFQTPAYPFYPFNRLVSKLVLMVISCFVMTAIVQGQSPDTLSAEPFSARKLTSADLAPHPLKSKYHNEFWTYHIYPDNGMHIILRFSVADFGMVKDAVSGAKISISNLPDSDNTYDAAKQYPYNQLSYDTSAVQLQLKEGKEIWFRGNFKEGHQIKFNTNKDGNSYDLDLKLEEAQTGYMPLVKSSAQPFNPAHPSSDIEIHIPVPHARFSGYLRLNGKRYDLTGTLYMDHIYMSNRLAKLLAKGYRFVSHTSDTSWIAGYLAETQHLDANTFIGYGYRKSGDKLELVYPEKQVISTSQQVDGREIPERLEVSFLPNTSHKFEFNSFFQITSVLEDVGGFKKFVAEKFLGGEVVNYRGQGLIDGQKLNFNYFEVK